MHIEDCEKLIKNKNIYNTFYLIIFILYKYFQEVQDWNTHYWIPKLLVPTLFFFVNEFFIFSKKSSAPGNDVFRSIGTIPLPRGRITARLINPVSWRLLILPIKQ